MSGTPHGCRQIKKVIPSVSEDVATLPVAEALLNLILSAFPSFVLSALALRDSAINIRSLSGISA